MVKACEIILFVLFLALQSCGDGNEQKEDSIPEPRARAKAKSDTLDPAKELAKRDTFPEIKYSRVCIASRKQLLDIVGKHRRDSATMTNYRVITTLNRKELRFFRVGDTIIVPDKYVKDLRAYSCLPQYYHDARELKKLVMVSNKMQCYGCYEFGALIRFAAANTGKEKTPTYPGRYAFNWKERNHRSSLDSDWVMPFTWNFHPQAGNAFHQFVMPGRPVSHSCVRQFIDDAEWLYYWGDGARVGNKKRIFLSGTAIIIFDIFDFSRKRYGPWLDLESNRQGIQKLPPKPMEYEEALIPWCQIPVDSRGSLIHPERFRHAEDTLRARGVIRPGVILTETKNFNKLRRDKAKREAKKKSAKQKKTSEENQSDYPG